MNKIAKRNDYLELENNIQTAIKESKSVIVLDENQVDKAGFYIKNYGSLEKKIEILRKSIVEPIKKEAKDIDSLFKSLKDKFLGEKSRLTEEVNSFLREKREREEQQRLLEQKEMEDSIIEEAEMFGDETILDNIPQVEFKKETLGNISENITSVRKKEWRLVDINKVPIEYLVVNEKLLNELRKNYDFNDKSPIPGIEFFVTEQARIK